MPGEHRDAHRMTAISAPAPLRNTIGTTPIIKAMEVISMGRRRKRPASKIACLACITVILKLLSKFDDQYGIFFASLAPPAQSALFWVKIMYFVTSGYKARHLVLIIGHREIIKIMAKGRSKPLVLLRCQYHKYQQDNQGKITMPHLPAKIAGGK